MEFKNEDLLTHEEFCGIIVSKFVKEIATVIGLKLKKYAFIQDNVIYALESNITYIGTKLSRDKLTNIVSNFIYKSYKNLTKLEVESIEKQYPKENIKIFKNAHIETYIPQLHCEMEKKNVIFDVTPNQIHFENGFVDTSNGNFYERDPTKHYITKCMKRPRSNISIKFLIYEQLLAGNAF